MEWARMAITKIEEPDAQTLNEKRLRLSRAYLEGAFNYTEDEAKLGTRSPLVFPLMRFPCLRKSRLRRLATPGPYPTPA